MNTGRLKRLFPFLDWFVSYNPGRFRLDLVGGLTVALVLVPQSMAYAQLAGLPAYYGLYAAFLPPMIAALFGSSRQLATGPVAIVSLMTATALEPLATAGSPEFIAYAILLALFVGTFQLLLGVFRLGVIVNFLSHPVVIGFTNAAALIIATSQLAKLFGVNVDNAEHHYETVYNVIKSALEFTHWPALALAAMAIVIMLVLRRINRMIPNVLAAVVATTLISWALGFENNVVTDSAHFRDEVTQPLLNEYSDVSRRLEEMVEKRVELREQYERTAGVNGSNSAEATGQRMTLELVGIDIGECEEQAKHLRARIRGRLHAAFAGEDGQLWFYPRDAAPDLPGRRRGCWRVKVDRNPVDQDRIMMIGGGAVVGNIPRGLPTMSVPRPDMAAVFRLFPMAMVISLLGFMEAISIAKAMAAKTGQRLDPNQELIGQGLANIVGSAAQSYAVSGSFSRSAVNLQAGAYSGLSSVISSLVVLVVLLFLTPLLYHLPQSVLASIIMMAVVSLINVKAFIHAWKAHRHDGIVALTTFVGTLIFAPHLDRGILIGVVLSLIFYLIRNMKPAMAILSRHPDGTYRDSARFGLQQCRHIAVIRYAGSLFFANVSYLENKVLETVDSMRELKHVLMIGNGMNEIDASGMDVLQTLLERLTGRGLRVSFSGLNDSVVDSLRRSGLLARIGEENLYRNCGSALEAIWDSAHEGSTEIECPLRIAVALRLRVSSGAMHDIEGKWAPIDGPVVGHPRTATGATPQGGQTVSLSIAGMDSEQAAAAVARALEAVAGVVRSETYCGAGRAVVLLDDSVSPDTSLLLEAVKKAGYEAAVE